MFSKVYWGLYALTVGGANYAVGVAHDGFVLTLIGAVVIVTGAVLLESEWKDFRNDR